MLHKLLTAIAFTLFISSVHADDSTFRAKGFEQLISAEWDGDRPELKYSVRFCLEIDASSQITHQYTLKLLNLNGGFGNFTARNNNEDSIPLKILMSDVGGSETLLPGRNSQSLGSDAFCKGGSRNLLLQITAYQLEGVTAGEYHSTIQLVASNEEFSVMAEYPLRIMIVVPELISIHGDKQIELKGLSHLQSEANLCVYRNGGGTYTIKAEGLSSSTKAFELSMEGRKSVSPLPYRVNIKSLNSSYPSITPGVLIQNMRSSKTKNCREGDNLKVQVVISDSAAEKAAAGIYQGELKITVGIQ